MTSYNYAKFSSDEYALSDFRGPKPGQKAPDFELSTVEGAPAGLLAFQGDFLVLELGSITCPLFQGRRKKMADLVQAHANVAFRILYVREAHPGGTLGKHHSEADKRANATALVEQDGEGRDIIVDTLDGSAHRAYGGFPNSVFIINSNGCVLYFSDWNNPVATGRALRALEAGRPATGSGLFLPPPLPAALKTLRDAGPGAAPDFFRSLPRLIWENLIKRNLRVLLGKSPKVAPDARC